MNYAGLKIYLVLFVTLQVLGSCASLPKPGSSLDEVEFSVFPHIVKRNGKYFLQYQISVMEGFQHALVRTVFKDIRDGKAYYYFSTPISHVERGQLVERPLDIDGLAEFASQDVIYWLNKDQTKTKLAIE